MNNNNRNNPGPRSLVIYLVILAVAFVFVFGFQGISGLLGGNTITELRFSDLVAQFSAGNVTEVQVTQASRQYQGTLSDGTKFVSYAPSDYDMAILSETYILPQTEKGTLTVTTGKTSNWLSILSWLPSIIMIVLVIALYRNMMGGGVGGKGVMNFGKNRAQMTKGGEGTVKFDDVAGMDEEKAELAEIVDFLKNPKKYRELGARIPKGILLVGPPGTGKTYVSKAVAGEAGVPFFSISGSDFVEMFVGVGASRVRDLFDEAKKNAPCIVFIDEIDAVGRRRGAGIGGGNDEREQTLNQLLVEMDGFGVNEGIIVLAATNRPDVLDPAILRPGRFDREITIGTPDIKGREAVFKVHSKGKPLGSDVDIKVLAKRTPGFTPADIENMMNEAALLTARRNGSEIHMDDVEEAITRVIAGPKKRSKVMSDKERRLTAFHEAGHAVVARSIPGSDPVHQVTIMPRGRAGGFTMSLPEEDKYYATKTDMLRDIQHLLGGRVAEAIVLGDISTGASNDLERATKIAHDMTTKYGMTEAIGSVNYSDADEVFLGRDFTSKQNFSEALASKIDIEIRRIIDECYEKTETILRDHRDELERVANALLQMETLDADQFEAIYTNSKTVEELESEFAEASKIRQELEDREREARKKREAEEAKKSEDPIASKLAQGKRVAVLTKDGKVVFYDPDDLKNGRLDAGEEISREDEEEPEEEEIVEEEPDLGLDDQDGEEE